MMANFIDRYEISLPKHIKSELNFIEKGIVSHNIEGELYFIFKICDSDTIYHDDVAQISLEFDPILRDEFPCVRMIIRFFDKRNEIFNSDHYFSIESEQELKHLYGLSTSGYMNIVFYDFDTSICTRFALNRNDLTEINKIIEQISS